MYLKMEIEFYLVSIYFEKLNLFFILVSYYKLYFECEIFRNY